MLEGAYLDIALLLGLVSSSSAARLPWPGPKKLPWSLVESAPYLGLTEDSWEARRPERFLTDRVGVFGVPGADAKSAPVKVNGVVMGCWDPAAPAFAYLCSGHALRSQPCALHKMASISWCKSELEALPRAYQYQTS